MSAGEPMIEVIAPAGIRDSVAIPMLGKTEEKRKRRDDLFFAVLDVAGHRWSSRSSSTSSSGVNSLAVRAAKLSAALDYSSHVGICRG